ncbi:MAG: hypothetical protein ACO37F_12420 [Pirellulales bacterium]
MVSLPGVGRKTANVVLGSGFGQAEGVHSCRPALAAAGAVPSNRRGLGGTRARQSGAEGSLDCSKPPADRARSRPLSGPQATLRGLWAGRPLPPVGLPKPQQS